jgi:hypothetical protein
MATSDSHVGVLNRPVILKLGGEGVTAYPATETQISTNGLNNHVTA